MAILAGSIPETLGIHWSSSDLYSRMKFIKQFLKYFQVNNLLKQLTFIALSGIDILFLVVWKVSWFSQSQNFLLVEDNKKDMKQDTTWEWMSTKCALK